MTKQHKAGIGWEKDSPDIIKAFTNALFMTHRNLATLDIVVLNKATVDAPGVIKSLLWRPCKHELYPFQVRYVVYTGLPMEAVIHNSVGSDVVCSI